MRSLLFAASLALVAVACSSSDDEGTPNDTTQQDAAADTAVGDDAAQEDASSQQDTGLDPCPEEVQLSGTDLIPCDCYGHEANEETLADPNVDGIQPGSTACLTQVVCCPGIQNLRCEDHEYLDDAGNVIDAAEDAPIPACPFETDLSSATLPCDCKGTVVTDPPIELIPDCKLSIVCCPSQGVICE